MSRIAPVYVLFFCPVRGIFDETRRRKMGIGRRKFPKRKSLSRRRDFSSGEKNKGKDVGVWNGEKNWDRSEVVFTFRIFGH